MMSTMAEFNEKAQELARIDAVLQKNLTAVKPRPAFVSRLKLELDQEIEKRQKTKKVAKGILVAGGIVGSAALIFTVIRSLTEGDGLVQTITRQISRLKKREGTASA